MFTGIIEDVGSVEKTDPSALWVRTALTEIKKGDSLAVNGICLTVTQNGNSGKGLLLRFDFSEETKLRANIGELQTGSVVNLERALRVGGRFGGHIMTGHIEDTGCFMNKDRKDNSWIFKFKVNKGVRKYIIPKGSVGVDGVSLTVVAVEQEFFTVSVVPYTMMNTNFGSRRPGDRVNIEPDILAKYAESLLNPNSHNISITQEFLKENGFID